METNSKLHLTSCILSKKEGKNFKDEGKKIEINSIWSHDVSSGSWFSSSRVLLPKHQRIPSVQNNLLFNSVKILTPNILIRLMHLFGAGVLIHPSKVSSQLRFNTAIFSSHS